MDECVVEEVVPEFFSSPTSPRIQYSTQSRVHHLLHRIGKPEYVNAGSCIIEEEDRTKRKKSYKKERSSSHGEYPTMLVL